MTCTHYTHLAYHQDIDDLRRLFGATEILEFTERVEQIKSQVMGSLPQEASECCNYRYQILDQYCAAVGVSCYLSRVKKWMCFCVITVCLYQQENLTTLCSNSEMFGYNDCDDCSRCLRWVKVTIKAYFYQPLEAFFVYSIIILPHLCLSHLYILFCSHADVAQLVQGTTRLDLVRIPSSRRITTSDLIFALNLPRLASRLPPLITQPVYSRTTTHTLPSISSVLPTILESRASIVVSRLVFLSAIETLLTLYVGVMGRRAVGNRTLASLSLPSREISSVWGNHVMLLTKNVPQHGVFVFIYQRDYVSLPIILREHQTVRILQRQWIMFLSHSCVMSRPLLISLLMVLQQTHFRYLLSLLWKVVEEKIILLYPFIFQLATCGDLPNLPNVSYPSCTDRTRYATYPNQEQSIAATVWYNNQVRH